jgi:MerR family copper efflux transcriptional regulator
MALIGIGAAARRAGMGIDTIRYYERAGLIKPQTRLESGYRKYSDAEVSRLRFIKRAQALGFTLKEIGELLRLSARKDVAQVKKSAQAKLADVDARIASLQQIRNGLDALIEACPGHGRPEDCPILSAFGEPPR